MRTDDSGSSSVRRGWRAVLSASVPCSAQDVCCLLGSSVDENQAVRFGHASLSVRARCACTPVRGTWSPLNISGADLLGAADWFSLSSCASRARFPLSLRCFFRQLLSHVPRLREPRASSTCCDMSQSSPYLYGADSSGTAHRNALSSLTPRINAYTVDSPYNKVVDSSR